MLHSKYIVFIILFFLLSNIDAQVKLNKSRLPDKDNPFNNDSSSIKKSKGFKKLATIDMYLQFNIDKDSILVDTTISIKKNYKFNYLQKDNFGLMPFANIGQTYNTLSFDPIESVTTPLFGARARHFNYLENEDVKYYEVPTPWTRLTYKTAFEQGQLLDAAFAVNLSKQFNFSIAYKGLRSLGNYQNALTSSGNFRFTTNYKSKNGKYKAFANVVMQDILNQENGGLNNDDIENFETGTEEFLDRSVFDLNFDNAENILVGKRFFLNHSYSIIRKKDSLSKNELSITNIISFEDKYYQYKQDSPSNDFFGNSFTSIIKDKTTLENFETQLGVNYFNNIIGQFKLAVNYKDVNYGYNSVIIFPNEYIPNRIKTSFFGLSGDYSKSIGLFNLKTKASINLSNEFKGSFVDATLHYKLNEDIDLKGGLSISSKLPNYNYLLYQSDYVNYNWNNFNVFENVRTQQVRFNLESQKYFNASVDVSNIDNYTFFNFADTVDDYKVIKPNQYNNTIQYLRFKLQKEIRVGSFALDNTIMYQNVVSDNKVLNVPAFISRNTLYYSNQLFKKAMTLQTGITLNYFTKYNMNGYDPLLAEFYNQNEKELGGFPVLDFFVNAKIRQTRIFFKAEHFNSSFTGYNYFSAPNHPFRDFTIRFGLVWDFFL
ncbi:putative porin [Winogradskyella echinorum]|uniref:Porin n=1 Tax=Winogradskyella echinorum TaxID=538189 RepID=A0ABR6Y479_9FLAO|nr:putative porin [Winogradskyella echinorum]MBC5751902.1 putative porin [Winogradskyella echinorum]